ncbi:hypothetical protein KIPB_005397 [Kipferlia bialata]|uniref:Uncharacterized protein n=1 Tax=Kipferlia bialata TaxID=797122 RepID=A0A9K3CVZ4_9EUKA|nr:hypothetical protein KIPB_005397 [Kipferlia bialata]|eukprot:g5397.t1
MSDAETIEKLRQALKTRNDQLQQYSAAYEKAKGNAQVFRERLLQVKGGYEQAQKAAQEAEAARLSAVAERDTAVKEADEYRTRNTELTERCDGLLDAETELDQLAGELLDMRERLDTVTGELTRSRKDGLAVRAEVQALQQGIRETRDRGAKAEAQLAMSKQRETEARWE